MSCAANHQLARCASLLVPCGFLVEPSSDPSTITKGNAFRRGRQLCQIRQGLLVESKVSTARVSILCFNKSLPDMSRYFLRKRDWASMNEGMYERFPFGQMVHHDPEEGDQGCDSGHNESSDQFANDCCAGVLLVSYFSRVRTMLRLLLVVADQYPNFITRASIYAHSARSTGLGSFHSVDIQPSPPWHHVHGRFDVGFS